MRQFMDLSNKEGSAQQRTKRNRGYWQGNPQFIKSMTPIRLLLLLLICIGLRQLAFSQCTSITLADSSFEDASFPMLNSNELPWIWNQTDGAELSTIYSYSGSYSVCSVGGGINQIVVVDSNTTYHVSCFIKNGVNDPFLRFIINDSTYPTLTVLSDNWTFASQQFHFGSDTIATVGIESNSACFDDFRLTCNRLVGIADLHSLDSRLSLFPTISSSHFTLRTKQSGQAHILNMAGSVVEQFALGIGVNQFGEDLPPAMYIVQVRIKGKIWTSRMVKH